MRFRQKNNCKLLQLAFITWFILVSTVCANEISGRVVGIKDGDTLTLLTANNRQYKIRLAEIDAPEKDQPFGERSKKILSDLVYGKQVNVQQTSTDRYGRIVGRIHSESSDISADMVSAGAAWVFVWYATDPELFELEDEAKRKQVGLWELPNPIPPWEWRKGNFKTSRSNQQFDKKNTTSPEKCKIKGNVNRKGDRIYHVPGSRDYPATVITESKGERWFCSEDEARLAGWRRPYR